MAQSKSVAEIIEQIQRSADPMERPGTDPNICGNCGQPAAPMDTVVAIPISDDREIHVYTWPKECAACCYERESHNWAEVARRDKEGMCERWFERSDLGRRLQKAERDFEVTDANREAHGKAAAWVEDPTRNVIIHGPIGCGKSYLAAWAFYELYMTEPCWWLSVMRLFETIKAGYEGGDGAAEFIGWAKKVPILFLDDLGKVHSTNVSWVEETLYSIIDVRYCAMLPTVVTTEYTGKALRQRVGESVVSRLEHGAIVAGIKAPAECYRAVAE